MLEQKQGQFWNLHAMLKKLWKGIFNSSLIFLMNYFQTVAS